MFLRISILITLIFSPVISLADPMTREGIILPPGSAAFVDDLDILREIGLSDDGIWCYDTDANAILITAPARTEAICELKRKYELEKQKAKYDFQIDNLKLRVETLLKQAEEIEQVKNQEIDRLTEAAKKRPNDYTVWWATGGFAGGILTTLAIVLALQN